jgi:hypothetical protein
VTLITAQTSPRTTARLVKAGLVSSYLRGQAFSWGCMGHESNSQKPEAIVTLDPSPPGPF